MISTPIVSGRPGQAPALQQMCVKFDAFDEAIEHAGSGDISSWNPIRNAWTDKRPALRTHLAATKAATKPLFDAVRQQAANADRAVEGHESAEGSVPILDPPRATG